MKPKVDLKPYTNEVIDMYVNQHMTTVDIAKWFGTNDVYVGRMLESNGIQRIYTSHAHRFTDEEKLRMRDLYLEGWSTKEIGDLLGCSNNAVSRHLRKQGVEIRRAVHRSAIKNHNYFHQIDTPAKAYFLGWMISDGCVVEHHVGHKRSPVISICIHEHDRYIVELFANELGAPKEIVHAVPSKHQVLFSFASQEMADDLSQYGVISRKTLREKLPLLDDSLMPHLLRGIFDGDGTVTYDHRFGSLRIGYYGSYDVCYGIRGYLHTQLGMRLNKINFTSCYSVYWGSRVDVCAFFNFVYANCGQYYLRRKFDRFISANYGNTEITNLIA